MFLNRLSSSRLVSILLVSAAFTFSTATARAGTISYTCAANINTLGPATLCNSFNTTVSSLYSNTFTNANASIFVQFGNTGLGSSYQYLEATSYAGYRSLLQSVSSGNPIDTAALASLPLIEPAIFGADNILVTGALAGAIAGAASDFAGTTSTGASCSTPGIGACYNAIVTLATPAILSSEGGAYYYRAGINPLNGIDVFTVVEHETDEVLGTISAGGTVNGAIADEFPGFAAPVDLFRYSAPGSRVAYTSTPAYFSFDGGVTRVAPFNYLPNGADYGDFSTTCSHVQDAFGCLHVSYDITTDGGPEIAILDAIGYNVTPEPASIALVGTALGLLTGIRRRRRA